VALLMFVYFLFIGVGDFYLVHKVLRRPHLTWFTFPVVALGFCVLAYFLAYGSKGTEIRVNQVDLIDVDVASRQARATTWFNVFSPAMETYDLSMQTVLPGALQFALPDREMVEHGSYLAWMGMPGSGIRGMSQETTSVVSTSRYDFSAGIEEMERVLIPTWSTKSFVARRQGVVEVPDDATSDGLPVAMLVDDDESPSGTVTNRFDFALNNCVLVYKSWAYELGTIEPRAVVRLGPSTQRRQLKSLLTGRAWVKGEKTYREETPPYDQANTDFGYVLRAMMFFGVDGVRSYTGLANGYQSFVDLSRALKTNRAILVAETPGAGGKSVAHASRLLRSGHPIGSDSDRRAVFYRFLLPVDAPRNVSSFPCERDAGDLPASASVNRTELGAS